MKTHILLIEDDHNVRKVTAALFVQAGYDVTAVSTGEDGLEQLETVFFDLVLTDLRLPGKDGIQVLREIKSRLGVPVVVFTAHGTIDDAVRAMKIGAFDFLEKPVDRDDLLQTVVRALEIEQSTVDVLPIESSLEHDLVVRASELMMPVLITGETGTGKSTVAKEVHERSSRDSFVTINCSAIPENLIESELFGHEKGAFTGATHRKPGRFELADGGTIFLDEIGDLPLQVQAKLLVVLQDKTFTRVGGTETIHSDFRLISATHRDLATMVKEEKFREDLFYRLNVIHIHLDPIRDRPEEFESKVFEMIELIDRENGTETSLEPAAIELMMQHPWPGNFRELKNVIERAVVLNQDKVVTAELLSRALNPMGAKPATGTLESARRDFESDLIRTTLLKCDGNRSRAARVLGVSRRTLYNKLAEFEIS